MINKYCKKEIKKMKNVIDIRDEFFDNGNKISAQSMQDLIWHIENDPLPDDAITFVTDAGLLELVHLVAKHLNHEDGFVRELTVGCLVRRLHLPEYAEIALIMAQNDPEGGPRTIAISSLGAVINKIENSLKKRIAEYLYRVLVSDEYDNLDKRCAFNSILEAMGVPISEQITTSYDPSYDLVIQFKIKYGV